MAVLNDIEITEKVDIYSLQEESKFVNEKSVGAQYLWSLNFKSITDIQNCSNRENQFFVLMNSEDEK
jgi:hypothetical protein